MVLCRVKMTKELTFMEELLENLAQWLPLIIGVVIVIILILSIHTKAPPNTAYIVSGFRKTPRILIGRTGFRIPILERIDRLILKQMTMEVHSGRAAPTVDHMEIQVSAIIKIKINEEDEALNKATKNFLNQYPEDTMNELQIPVQAILREIIGSKKLQDIIKDQEAFAKQFHQRAAKSLSELGLSVLSCVIKSVEDEAGILKAMGMEKSTEIQKSATLIKAEADREIIEKTAKAKKEANEAHVLVEGEIAKKNQELELLQARLKKDSELKNLEFEAELAEKSSALKIKQANLKKNEEKNRAEVEMTFEEETLARRTTFEIAQNQAKLDKEDRELKLREKAAQITEQLLEAEVKKTAEAENYRQQQIANSNFYIATKTAEAQKLQAETTNYIAEQEIQTAKAKDIIKKQEADTQLYLKKQELEAIKLKAETEAYTANQEANAKKQAGLCEADVIEAKGVAEAQSRALKSEAMQNYSQAAIVEMVVSVLPEIAKNIAQPVTEVENMAILADGTKAITGANQDVLETMKKMQEMVQGITGININDASKNRMQLVETATSTQTDKKPESQKQ